MNLVERLEQNPGYILSHSLRELLSLASECAEGGDKPLTSEQFQSYLANQLITPSKLYEYVDSSLTGHISCAGYVVRDIANELGSRLGFAVDRGTGSLPSAAPSYDGVWFHRDSMAIAVDLCIGPRKPNDIRNLLELHKESVSKRKAGKPMSMLFVVGRDNTSQLENIVRNLDCAKYVRVVSLDKLATMLLLFEASPSNRYGDRLRALLEPEDYVRIDSIIDLAAEAPGFEKLKQSRENITEVRKKDSRAAPDTSSNHNGDDVLKGSNASIRAGVILAFNNKHSAQLVKGRGSQTFYSADRYGHGVCVLISRLGQGSNSGDVYWFGYSYKQNELLKNRKKGYLAFACAGKRNAGVYVIPHQVFARHMHLINQAMLHGRPRWHIHLQSLHGQMYLKLPGHEPLNIEEYRMEL